jgi:glycosyltransferase involved in cell wall biosynthesis
MVSTRIAAQTGVVGAPRQAARAKVALDPAPDPAPLRVLLVTARYLPSVGGTEIHTYEVAKRLSEAGNDVTVLTTDLSGQLPADERIDGVRILRVRAWPAQRDYFFAPGLDGRIVGGGWDIVHCQGCHTLVAPIAMLAALRAHIPYIVTFHSGGHSSRLRKLLRRAQWALLRPLLARAERLIGVSNWEAEFFRDALGLPADRFVVIPNGAYLPELAEPSKVAHEGTMIISVGRLERYKGHHRVLQALPDVARQVPDVRLRIVGSGPYAPTLWRMARELGVEDRVEIGAVAAAERHAMAALLSGAKLVLLLSDYESQGMAVMEAIALGRPVLVAETSALQELAQGGLVRATPLGSTPAEIARAIVDQLRQPLVPSSIDLPTWDTCAAEILSLYHSIVRRQSCAS